MKYKFSVPDMSCNHCKMRIEKVMNESGKVKDLSIDLNSKLVSMDSTLSEEEIINLFDKAGYDATKIS
ncbi:MAG TPA: heavy-metal-associated domain-containing protein [Spirochaetota bacterium]|jgi:copper chaperone|nr:heavy-metal-associated domain-containing protein [Spirochaetota bacterium]OQA99653.1 MAG: Heavy-metal-associated domain protein [Spirochaetes bacterium ADurb.Bin218]HOK02644.1 heavy-metal-associated domain-containing protein [Spirochaetota bacterium]HOK92851.1 heavy-metal-associated domain-containing protein [Spirochaetota bacterium]HOQ11878.1 heavy-metal-associated domain-containing protein [Spirochaetota bacterium]